MKSGGFIDVNTWLGPWPFQYFRDDSAGRLESRLTAEGIAHAMVGSPEAAFNPDSLAVNRILLKRLAGSKALHPVLAIDPSKGDWKDNLALARDEGVGALRLFPNYHCYELGSAAALAVVEEIAKDGGFVLYVQMRMEDERTHHPLCKIPGVKAAEVVELSRRFAGLPVIAACPYYHEAVELVKESTNIRFDLSHVETMRTVASLVSHVPQDRVLFGSHTPFLQTRSVVMKVDAPYVTEDTRHAIGGGNARAILGKALRARR